MPEHQPHHPPTPEQEPTHPTLEHYLEHDFVRQYETRVNSMQNAGLLELLPNIGEMGIIGMDGQEYPIPSMEAIKQELTKTPEKKALLETKMKQGFTEIDLTPMAMPIEKLHIIAQKVIKKHYAAGKLFATKKNPNDPNEQLVPLDLDTANPFFLWDTFTHADTDTNNPLIYFPKQFNKDNHGGLTKPQWLTQSQSGPFPGWDISFQESSINIPRQGQGKTIGGRKQLETNQTPNQYLNTLLTNPAYQGESGTTIEQWITKLITTLEETNQVIDDWEGHGSLNYLIAQYLPASGNVPDGDWDRDGRQANVGGSDPRSGSADFGARPAVRFSGIGV